MLIRILQILPLCDCCLDGAEIGVGLQHFLQHGEQQQIVSTHFVQHKEQSLPILNDYLQKIL
jgi:hypothetical protein